MRHGCNPVNKTTTETTSYCADGLKCIQGDMLGCYFCNDITSPGDVSCIY